ncbi:hypothetical protein KIPB_013207, partial [Kipferlia bialata]
VQKVGTNELYACKFMKNCEERAENWEEYQKIIRETDILTQLQSGREMCPYILRLHDAFVTCVSGSDASPSSLTDSLQKRIVSDKTLVLITELLDGEELTVTVQRRKEDRSSVSVDMVLDIIRQLLTAVVYCHDQNIIHRDIKVWTSYI